MGRNGLMSAMPEKLTEATSSSRFNDYDRMAEGYTNHNETGLQNAYYERPAMLELAGDVTGRRMLDYLGCREGVRHVR
ncbi:hypothetical protein ACTMTI_47710 [Nonomuraea sp. H19]|uniref:hypothetical protein n=1 Tax=Nonomuraea sp. H19 TaxID=3452206 RepID=UPI003F8C96F9